MNETSIPPLPYDPEALPRETARHYIPATEQDIQAMLGTLGLSQLDELFQHIPVRVRMTDPPALPEELSYEALYQHVVGSAVKLEDLYLRDDSNNPVIDRATGLPAYNPNARFMQQDDGRAGPLLWRDRARLRGSQ